MRLFAHAGVLAVVAFALGCVDNGAPQTPDARATVFEGPSLRLVDVSGGDDGDPPPPPIDTMSTSTGGGASTTFLIYHRATFTSDLAGTMGWIAWGQAKQPEGTKVEGEAQVYYRKGFLVGKGTVRMSTRKGAFVIDFSKHLDTTTAAISTTCKSERGGACATLTFRDAAYVPADGRPERVSGRLLIGVSQKK